MKRTITAIIIAVIAAVAAVSCQKAVEPENAVADGRGTVSISVSGLMGEYAQEDGTKAELVNNVRVSWDGGETVYVFDGKECLGSLAAALEGGENRYALLSTDGGSHTVKEPVEGTTKLTLVYSPLMTEAPTVSEGKITVSLAEQSEQTAPFVVYATLDYVGKDIKDKVVPFKFATSVIRVNCMGLEGKTAITKATVSPVNTACVLSLNGTADPGVDGAEPGIITRTGGSEFSSVNDEGEVAFQIAVPKLSAGARTLTVFQGASEFEDEKFSSKALNIAISANTICQLKSVQREVPEGFVDLGVTNAAGNPVYWAEKNLGASKPQDYGYYYFWAGTTGYTHDGSKWVIAGTTTELSEGFCQSNAPYYENSAYTKYTGSDSRPVLDPVDDAATVTNSNWRTPTKDEFVALAANCVWIWCDGENEKYNNTAVKGYIVYKAKSDADKGKANMNGTWKKWTGSSYSNDSSTTESYSISDTHIFFPAAGYGNSTSLDLAGTTGSYWSSTLYSSIWAYSLLSNSSKVDPQNFLLSYRFCGFSVRPVTEGGSSPVPPVQTYTVTFNMNGHGTAPADVTGVTSGSTITKPAPDPTAAGYVFGGWYKEAACTNAWNFATDKVTANTTLYAKWVPDPEEESHGESKDEREI